jgi:hypothetical protein
VLLWFCIKVNLDQLKSELGQLRKSINELDKLLEDPEPNIPFYKKMTTFCQRAETEINLVEKLLPDLDKGAIDLATFFGEDPNKSNVLDTLNLIREFSESFVAAREDVAKQKEVEAKRLAREAKKAAEAAQPRTASRAGLVRTLPGEQCNVDSILAQVRKGGFVLKRTPSQASLDVSR